MSELSLIPETLTMSSREIAELTGKQHAHVMRDIRAMLVELYGEEGLLKFQQTLTNPQNGQSYTVFNLDREHAMTLITGYSIKLRYAIIKRWQELEAQVKKLQAEAYEKSFEKLDRSLRAIEHISTTPQTECLK